MLRIVTCCIVLLLASTAARAERICDLEDRFLDADTLSDGDTVTISGRIVETYDRDKDGTYAYDIEDSCGVAFVSSKRPIACSGTVTVTGEFDEEASDEELAISIWATRFSCR
jgi:hypothetical protein